MVTDIDAQRESDARNLVLGHHANATFMYAWRDLEVVEQAVGQDTTTAR